MATQNQLEIIEKCPDCGNNFKPYTKLEQQYPYKRCFSCKQKSVGAGSAASPSANNDEVMDALRKVYVEVAKLRKAMEQNGIDVDDEVSLDDIPA